MQRGPLPDVGGMSFASLLRLSCFVCTDLPILLSSVWVVLYALREQGFGQPGFMHAHSCPTCPSAAPIAREPPVLQCLRPSFASWALSPRCNRSTRAGRDLGVSVPVFLGGGGAWGVGGKATYISMTIAPANMSGILFDILTQGITRSERIFHVGPCLGPPVVPFHRFFVGGGFPYQNRLQHPYSILSTGGPSCGSKAPEVIHINMSEILFQDNIDPGRRQGFTSSTSARVILPERFGPRSIFSDAASPEEIRSMTAAKVSDITTKARWG